MKYIKNIKDAENLTNAESKWTSIVQSIQKTATDSLGIKK